MVLISLSTIFNRGDILEIKKMNSKDMEQVAEMIYEEKKNFYDELFGKNAAKYIKEAFNGDISPFIKSNTMVLQDGEKIKAVLLHADKSAFRRGYQKWFKILGFRIFPVGAKMIYIIERILIDFSVDDIYIVSLYGEMKEFLLYNFIKANRYKRIITDTLDEELFKNFGFAEMMRPVHPKLKRLEKFCDYEGLSGIGWDTHPLVESRRLVVGGIEIDSEFGLLGHSDADVLTHAIIDSLVGIIYKKDIGSIFPENNENKDKKSLEMLDAVVGDINGKGYFPSSIDCVIISPIRLGEYRGQIIASLESILKCPVSVKFKSGNGVYPESDMKGITAMCVSNVDKISN